MPEAVPHEGGGRREVPRGHERSGPPHDPQDGCVDARRRCEGGAVDPPGDRELVADAPEDALEGARPRGRPLQSEPELDDQVCPVQRHERVAEQPREQCGRDREREVGDDRERLARPRHQDRVDLEDAEACPAQLGRETRIALDGDDVCADPREGTRERSVIGADVQHRFSRRDPGGAHELVGEPATAEEVLAVSRARAGGGAGHGRSPPS